MKATVTIIDNIADVTVRGIEPSVPGRDIHDVDVSIDTVRGARPVRVLIDELWGSHQGYREIYRRRTVVSRGATVTDAIKTALSRAKDAGLDTGMVHLAVAEAQSQMDS